MSHYARHYARFHPDTPEHDAQLRVLLERWLKPHLPADQSCAVLDIGCGRGYALGLLAGLGYKNLAGIDCDPGQVEFAASRGRPVTLVPDTVQFLRSGGPRYDFILLMDVLEHVPVEAQPALLDAIRTSLRPGGRLLCTVPNAASALASYWRYIDYTHRIAFTHHSLEYALHLAGLEPELIQPVEFITRPRYLFWLPTRRATQWWLLCLSRGWQRIVSIAELGWEQGRQSPLSLNLLAVARRD